ncbi:MAG TPA: hypothetical protein ACQGQU_07655, partial [Xylella fastidiosa subsp. multiplex]
VSTKCEHLLVGIQFQDVPGNGTKIPSMLSSVMGCFTLKSEDDAKAAQGIMKLTIRLSLGADFSQTYSYSHS